MMSVIYVSYLIGLTYNFRTQKNWQELQIEMAKLFETRY